MIYLGYSVLSSHSALWIINIDDLRDKCLSVDRKRMARYLMFFPKTITPEFLYQQSRWSERNHWPNGMAPGKCMADAADRRCMDTFQLI